MGNILSLGISLFGPLSCLLLVHFLVGRVRRYYLTVPPGPKPLPILGNLRDLPTTKPWLAYQKWGKEYNSDLIYLSAPGQRIIILNSIKATMELLERRSHCYSDRPPMPMIEMMGWDFNVAMLPYGDVWRKHRRIFQQGFAKAISENYEPVELEKVHDMLRALLTSPEEFMEHAKTVSAAIIMATMYGYDISPKGDYFVGLSEEATGTLMRNVLPGAVAVNTFPFLRHIPSWVPGIRFWKIAKDCQVLTRQMQDVPYNFVKKQMEEGTAKPSLLASLLTAHEQQNGSSDEEEIIKGVTATAYAAGADTTVVALGSFYSAMALHPDACKKAQEEIDEVVGTDRLPNFDDRKALPYVEAVYREVLRWRPVVPLGLPHACNEDDVYEGYVILKGTVVVGNIWAMTHDETVYPEPDSFKPERFFDADGNLNDDDNVLTFGFGRRVCVGRHMASSTVWLIMVSVLATFNITKAKDEMGRDIEINPTYTDGAISHIEPFQCSFTPRSAKARQLVEETGTNSVY